jgi:hypothetical protein
MGLCADRRLATLPSRNLNLALLLIARALEIRSLTPLASRLLFIAFDSSRAAGSTTCSRSAAAVFHVEIESHITNSNIVEPLCTQEEKRSDLSPELSEMNQ